MLLAKEHTESPAGDHEVTSRSSRPWPGEQLGGQEWVVVEARLEPRAEGERSGEELGLGESFVIATPLVEEFRHVLELVDEGAVPPGEFLDGPESSGDRSGVGLPADLEIVFELPPEERLVAAMQKLGIDFTNLSDVAGHA